MLHLNTVYMQHNYHPFINLTIVNYLLTGLQIQAHRVLMPSCLLAIPAWGSKARRAY